MKNPREPGSGEVSGSDHAVKDLVRAAGGNRRRSTEGGDRRDSRRGMALAILTPRYLTHHTDRPSLFSTYIICTSPAPDDLSLLPSSLMLSTAPLPDPLPPFAPSIPIH